MMRFLAFLFAVSVTCIPFGIPFVSAPSPALAQGNPGDGVVRDESSGSSPKGESSQTHLMEEVVVVAPPVIEGNQVNRLGSQVTTVTEKQIEDLNAQDFASALRQTPGVVVSHHNPIGSFGGGEGGAIFIRGKGISRPGAEVQILIDGIPKFVGVWTHPVLDVLSVDIVDKMEVYKGAQPVLFGNMAFGAVDIATKRIREDGFYSSVETAAGSYNTWVEVTEHGGKMGPFDYYLVQSFRSSDGHRTDADGELQNYFARLGYQFTPHLYGSVILNHSDNWADDPGSVDGSIKPDGRFKTNDYFTVATLANQYDLADGYIKIYSDLGHIDWINQYNDGARNGGTYTDWNNYGVRARERLKPWEGGELLFGMDIDYITGKADFAPDSTHFDETAFRLVSPYMALSQLFGSKDSFYAVPSAGIRYISHNKFKDEPGPQAGLTFGYKDTELHASYARGINYPGIFANLQDTMFMPMDNQWQNLTAELVDHFEAGISQKINNMAKMDLTFFYDDGSDRIVVATPPPFPPVWTNVGSFTQKGVEATVTITPIRDLSFFAGATYLKSDPDDLPYAPEWSASFGVNYRFLKDFQISVDSVFVDDQFVFSRGRSTTAVNTEKVGSYYVLSAKLTYDFIMPCYRNVRAQLFLAGENLTDTEYEQKKGYPMPGISGMGGIKLRF
ncbi:MAG: TonB-dependent receptor plug domain-containing protein [Syntrophobacter sp.]